MTIRRCFRRLPIVVMLAFALTACGPRAPSAASATAAPSSPAAPREWPLPAIHGRQPDLAPAPDGALLLSWTEGDGARQRLRFARWTHGRWTAPRDVAAGAGLGNAADTPHVRQTPDGALWATWLRTVGHASDVMLARSADGGASWSAPVAVNTDRTATEHGFAALWADGRDALGVAWLDGRDMAGGAHGHATRADPHPATMLRTAVFDARLARRAESAIDTATCDCCQTDVAVLADGPRVVYRDRAPGEIRDIALLARVHGRWSAPRSVHRDGWRMPGCPVNGPAVAGAGRELLVAWYTMRGDVPTVRVARSGDGGETFAAPLDLAASADVLGRVDVAADGHGAWVGWLTEGGRGQVLHAAQLARDGGVSGRAIEIATLAGRGRATGWPRLAATPDGLRAVWTDVVDGRPVLRGAWLPAAGHARR